MDSDGLIGMDVFSSFLVTLDFPMRKLVLGTLPKRPDEEATAKPTLQTEQKSDGGAVAACQSHGTARAIPA